MFRVGQKVLLKPVDKCKDTFRFGILGCMEILFGQFVTISQISPEGYSGAYKIEEDGGSYFYEQSWFEYRQRSE